jgi:uncharacterized membrane protein YkoI
MRTTRKYLVVAGSALALAAGGAGVAVATGGSGGEAEDASEQATGAGADRAKSAALEATNGGTANSVERDSEKGATWEVEITKSDGQTVDVRLDDSYRVVVVENEANEDDGGADHENEGPETGEH